MSIKIASHLYRNRHGTFYFRLVIPSDLRGYFKQRETRFSLNTEQRQQAKNLAMFLVADIPHHLMELRRMAEKDDTPMSDKFRGQWLEQVRVNINLKARIDELEQKLDDAEHKLKKSTPSKIAKDTVIRAYQQGQLKNVRELQDKFIFPWPPERTPLFSELLAAYMKSLKFRATGGIKKPPSEKTLEEYNKSIEFFITVMKDLRIGEIDREIVGEYFSTLKKLPANLTRLNKYLNKSITEIIDLGDTPQSEVNVSKKIERISTMYKWALDEKRKWGIDTNPFTGFGQAENIEKRRRPFKKEELIALFNHPNFINQKFNNSYSFWLIPLALFTGARLGELCQLDLKDFVNVEGVECIDINDIEGVETQITEGGRKKRVKNKNAKRLVPIHSVLIEIGLIRYVNILRLSGEKYLFPELSRNRRDGPAHTASNWFQRFRKEVGLITKQETVFHSFRHLFITNILDIGVPPHMIAPIVGHEAELVTGKVYWDVKDARLRKPTVEKFEIHGEVRKLILNYEKVTFKSGTKY